MSEPTTKAGRRLAGLTGANRADILAIEAEARADAIDMDALERAFVTVIDRRPVRVEVTYFYRSTLPVEVQRQAFLRDLAAEYRAILAERQP